MEGGGVTGGKGGGAALSRGQKRREGNKMVRRKVGGWKEKRGRNGL